MGMNQDRHPTKPYTLSVGKNRDQRVDEMLPRIKRSGKGRHHPHFKALMFNLGLTDAEAQQRDKKRAAKFKGE